MTKLITIATFDFPTQAYVLKTRLEADGIYVFLKNELHAQVNNFQSNAIGGVQIQVLEHDLERAIIIVEDFGIDVSYKPSFSDKILLKAHQIGEKLPIFTKRKPLERVFLLIGSLIGGIAVLSILFVYLVNGANV